MKFFIDIGAGTSCFFTSSEPGGASDTGPTLLLSSMLSSQHVSGKYYILCKSVSKRLENNKIHPTGKRQSVDSNMDFLTLRGEGRLRILLSSKSFSL